MVVASLPFALVGMATFPSFVPGAPHSTACAVGSLDKSVLSVMSQFGEVGVSLGTVSCLGPMSAGWIEARRSTLGVHLHDLLQTEDFFGDLCFVFNIYADFHPVP